VVRVLLEHGGDGRARDLSGYEPLHVCAWAGFEEIARVLIDVGADVSSRSDQGTPLQLARRRGNREMEELLRAAGGS
jgi:ankyrin repeat protein